jgi:hypothetical protein
VKPANDNKPLAVTRKQAAEICGLSPAGFDVWVRKGIMPPPIKGTRRWSRLAIENAINGMDPVNAGLDAFEIWELQNARAS